MTDLRICFVGDSFVNGTGDREGLGWAGRICIAARARGLAVTRYDLGVRRDTSAHVRRRCAAEVSARLEGVACDGRVVLSFGANDALLEDGRPRVALSGTLANADAVLAWCAARHPTLMIGPPPLVWDAAVDERAAAIGAGIAERCVAHRVPFLDLRAALAADARWRAEALAGDGAHPDAGGYARAAAAIEAWEPWRRWSGFPASG